MKVPKVDLPCPSGGLERLLIQEVHALACGLMSSRQFVAVAHGQNEDGTMVGYADLSTKLLSFVLQACETMPAGGKREAAGDAVEIGSAVVRAGLPAAGEAAPLVVVVALFIAAGAMILRRAERRNASPKKAALEIG